MFSESSPFVRRIIRFLLLPYCYLFLVNWRECSRSRLGVLFDFLYIFFVLRDYPDNYGACRLWEVERSQWARYFGSNYNPIQKSRLRREVNSLARQIVYNDKHICDLMCRGIGAPVPKFVAIIEPGERLLESLRVLFETSGETRLVIKPVSGHAGLGVMIASKTDQRIEIRTGRMLLQEEEVVVADRLLVQGVVIQVQSVAEIAPHSLNTIRVLTMLTRSGDVLLIGASMRFGVGESVVDNWSAGGVAVGVDPSRGTLLEVAYDKLGTRYFLHPVSKFRFFGFQIPRWDEVVSLAMHVQTACPFNKLLGMDVAVTENGVVLIEINPDADIVFQEQTSGPLFSRRETWEAFRDYDLLFNRPQRALRAFSE